MNNKKQIVKNLVNTVRNEIWSTLINFANMNLLQKLDMTITITNTKHKAWVHAKEEYLVSATADQVCQPSFLPHIHAHDQRETSKLREPEQRITHHSECNSTLLSSLQHSKSLTKT